MPDIAAIGDANSIMMFKAIGASTYEAETLTEAQASVKKALGENYALVFITENLQPAVQEILEDNPHLVHLFIPPIREATKAGAKVIGEIIQKAVGAKH